MKTLLLSKQDIENIRDRGKTFVLKRKCAQTKLALLCTLPFSAVGIAEVIVHSGRPKKLYEALGERLGIDKSEFYKLFENGLTASVVEIVETSWMEAPCPKEDILDLQEFMEGTALIKAINSPIPEKTIKSIIKSHFIDKNISICKAFQECLEKNDFYPECEKYIYN